MRLALCNEVIREMPFDEQCAFAASVGYDAMELAPFTLSDEPHLMPAQQRAEVRRGAEAAGLAIDSLHWLLVKPDGLSITSPDAAVRARTVDVMRRLVDLCAGLGGKVLVHGSPSQRRLERGNEAEGKKRAMECFVQAAEAAERAGVVYCLEALSLEETNFVNSVAEAVEIVEGINSPAFRTMLDCCAAGRSEKEPPTQLVDRWLPAGMIAHVQVNDRNRRGPGEGADRFAPLLASLRGHGYSGTIAVEPFIYMPDGPACAARSIGYLRGILEALP